MNIDEVYIGLVRKVLTQGKKKESRTGVNTISTFGLSIEYDMKKGFPLLTTKKMAWKSVRVELEGFIKGVTDKLWYQERGCKFWDFWANPQKAPYGHTKEAKEAMLKERDLGRIYGASWRNFGGQYEFQEGEPKNFIGGVDQLRLAINTIKTNPNDRRIIINAWDAKNLNEMGLPPCHYGMQFNCRDEELDLLWTQRSVDAPIGLPANIASYALLLELMAKECGMKAGKLVGHFGDVHVYEDQLEPIEIQMDREPYDPPRLALPEFSGILNWSHDKTKITGYKHHPSIKFPVAV